MTTGIDIREIKVRQLAHETLLGYLLEALARQSDDPKRYLAETLDALIKPADELAIEQPTNIVAQEMGQVLQSIVLRMGRRLD